jgi:hypothetical protein
MYPCLFIAWHRIRFAWQRVRLTSRKRRHLHLSLPGTLDILARKQGAQTVDDLLYFTVVLRTIVTGNALDNDSEHLIVRELTALPVAQFADELPEVHTEGSVFH